MSSAIFKKSCPNCKGDISSVRLRFGLPCFDCIQKPLSELIKEVRPNSVSAPIRIYNILKHNGKLKKYSSYVKLLKEVNKFRLLFKRTTGSDLWNAQIAWAKRALSGKSFAILAPTGMGKTVFSIFLSIYFAQKNKKTYFILPTSLLAKQVSEKILNYLEKIDLGIKVAYYHSMLKKREKEEQMNNIKDFNFDILITTSMFLSRKFDLIKNYRFDLIIVDDVDSFLKTSKNVDKVLLLLGFPQNIIEKAFELIDLRQELLRNSRFKTLTDSEVAEKQKQIETLENEIQDFLKKRRNGVLIVSGASTRAKVKRVMLFRELLGFEIGSKIEGIRNVEDIYYKPKRQIEEEVYEWLVKFGGGGLVFVPMDKGTEYVMFLEKYLQERGLKAKAYTSSRHKTLDEFVEGKIDYLIGIASYRSPLARGLDLPERIRYAVFAGVPKFKIHVNISEFKPSRLIMLLVYIRDFFDKEERDKIDSFIAKLKKVSGLTEENRKKVIEAIQKNEKLDGFLGYCQNLFIQVSEFLKSALSRKEIVEKIKSSKKLSFGEELNELYFIIPDVSGYIQASGRTSRMYAGGVAKGASLVIIDDDKAFNGLVDKLRWFLEDVKFKSVENINLEKLLRQIDEDREKIKSLKEGKIVKKGRKEIAKLALMIVESPNKARTIARFFGKPGVREINGVRFYETSTGKYLLIITASMGHVFDLVTKEGYHGVLTKNDKFIPIYGSIKRCPKCFEQYTDEIEYCPNDGEKLQDKRNILDAIREVAKEVDEILIATDADAEGEKIGWDIAMYLRPFNRKIKRLEFHEITKRAILHALDNPRKIDENLVKAQIVRRIEDRWIGFELSQKVQRKFNRKSLSAGRVQTPVLGWVVERTLNLKKSIVNFFEVELENGIKIVFEKKDIDDVGKFKEKIKNSKLIVKKVEEKEEEINPLPPYTTDSMLRDASSILKLSAPETMALAQNLFEAGLCVTPDTIVSLSDGSLTSIKNVIRRKERNVLGINGLKIKKTEVKKFWEIEWDGKIKTIRLSNGHEIKSTPDHGLFVMRNGKIGWVSAKNIKPGDYVAFVYNSGHKGRKNYTLLELLIELGIFDVMVGFDKSYFDLRILPMIKERITKKTKYKYIRNRVVPLKKLVEWKIDINDYEPHVKFLYRQRASSKKIPNFKLDEKFWYLFGLVLGRGSITGSKVFISQTPLKQARNIIKEALPFIHVFETSSQVGFSNSILTEMFRRLGARSGELNPIIFTLAENMVNSFISGYFDSDGCFSLLHDGNVVSFRVCISSKRLDILRKISIYLYHIGILNYLRKDKRNNIWNLVISDRSLSKFRRKIYPHLRMKKELFGDSYSVYRKLRKTNESDLLPIVEVLKNLKFPKSTKSRITIEEGIDVRDWIRKNDSIPRNRIHKILRYIKDEYIRKYLISLVEANLTWIRVLRVDEEHYSGKLYDFTTLTENFLANGMLSHNCTYHRTDSTRVSNVGINIAKEYITENLSKDLFRPRSWSISEGAHECIRPTKPFDTSRLIELIKLGILQLPIRLTKNHFRLYDLIFKRFIASQMKPARVIKTKYRFVIDELEKEEEHISKILDAGFSQFVRLDTFDIEEGGYRIRNVRHWKAPKLPLYTQADLISLMKERKIGRPSTYAKIISTLFERRYIKQNSKGRISFTKLGFVVYRYLSEKFGDFISEEVTRNLQNTMDEIEKGKKDYQEVIRSLYRDIQKIKNIQ